MLVEVCIDSEESAANAVYHGADELEVCSELSLGGLTPSLELVKNVIDMITLYVSSHPNPLVKRPKVNVMIRCREGWDFCYNNNEVAKMLEDISDFATLGVDRFVFGALTDKQDVDTETCEKVIAKAFPKPVTFHRAFDVCKDPIKAIEDIIQLGFNRVLTSGQKDSAAQIDAVELIDELQKAYGDNIEIMPGAGINPGNARIFKDMGCKIIHGSFKREKQTVTGEIVHVTDGNTVTKVKEIVK